MLTCRALPDRAETSLLPFAAFVLLLALSLIGGALLAYPLSIALDSLIDEPLYRLVTRAAMLLALIGSPWFLRWMRLNSAAALGYGCSKRHFMRALCGGLLAGIAILAPLTLVLTGLGLRAPDPAWVFSWPVLGLAVAEALLSAVLVGFIEETFFRGAMFTAIDRHSGLAPAVILTALFYASLHFIRARYEIPPGQLEWYSGLIVLGHCFYLFGQPAMIMDSFLALCAAGVLLALVRARTGHIGWCIGIHAGWVLVIKLTKDLTNADYTGPLGYLIGHYDGIIGYLALAWVGLLAAMYGAASARRTT